MNLVGPDTQEFEHGRVDVRELSRYVRSDHRVESRTKPSRSEGQLVRECTLPRFQRVSDSRKGPIEAPSPFGLDPDRVRSRPTGRDSGQSSMPSVGDDGTAISRDGMRPARYASRPAMTACFIAYDIRTG